MKRIYVFPLMLVCHGFWRAYPAIYTCLAAWTCSLLWYVLWYRESETAWRPTVCLGGIGALSNALVTLVNGGMMPVIGKLESDGDGPWVTATEAHHLLLLADRVEWWGFSLGDVMIIGSLPLAIIMVVIQKYRTRWIVMARSLS